MSDGVEMQEKENNYIEDCDFEIIYSDDIEKIKELDNDNKNDRSTNISDGTNDIKQINSINNLSEIKLDINKDLKFEKPNFSHKSFISLDSKNYLIRDNPNNSYNLYNKLKSNYENDDISKRLKELTKRIKYELFSFLFPGIDQDFFSICKNISKSLKIKDLINKSVIENNLNYFLSGQKYYEGDTILIDKNFISNCGPILAYSYNRLKKIKIKDQISFLYSITKVINEKVNVKNEFDDYFSGKKIKSDKLEHIKYFKKIRKKYVLLPEIIYLINLFIKVKKIIIDININIKEYNITLLYYYILCLLNFPFIMKNIENIKFNFLNDELLKYIYETNKSKLINSNEYFIVKKNKINKKFIQKGKSIKNEKEYFLSTPKLIDIKRKIFFNEFGEQKENLYNSSKNLNISINKNGSENDKELLSNFDKKITNFFISYKKKFINIILEMIILLFVSLDNFANLQYLELILIDAYYFEFFSYFRDKLKKKIENFHILHLINNNLVKLKTINLEINSFDLITFNQILNIVYNCSATSLALSFFTTDYINSPPFIYRIYIQNRKNKLLKNNINILKEFNNEFYRVIYPKFVLNLNSLFEILKYKNLLSLSINFKIPSYILNNEKYIIVFIKFILNVLILSFNDNEPEIRELMISSPSLIMNGTKHLVIEEFLQNNNIKNNHILNLNIHLKFFNIRNLYKFIPEKLKVLSIGDLDSFSFKHFIDDITEYKFVQNSSLEQLSIKLNNIIEIFDKEIKLIMAKLFNIEIQNLFIYLYTNIQINLNEFKEIIDILQHNWNFNYFLTFNIKSKQIVKENSWMTKRLISLIPKKSDKSPKEKTEKSIASFFYINQLLKKLIIKANNKKIIDFYIQKKIISNIFSFLCEKKATDVHFYENLK